MLTVILTQRRKGRMLVVRIVRGTSSLNLPTSRTFHEIWAPDEEDSPQLCEFKRGWILRGRSSCVAWVWLMTWCEWCLGGELTGPYPGRLRM